MRYALTLQPCVFTKVVLAGPPRKADTAVATDPVPDQRSGVGLGLQELTPADFT